MKRRILSLLLVLTLLLALPVAAAAADDHTGHKLSYYSHAGNRHEVYCDTCKTDIAPFELCSFENGVCKFCRWECKHGGTVQSYDNPVTCENCGMELPQLAKTILDKVELTTQGYEYGKAISELQLVASQKGVTASVREVRDPNQGGAPVTTGTFDEQNYKVCVNLVPETGYELGENCVVTLNGKADSGDNIFQLDLPARSFTVTFVTSYGTPNPQTVQRGGNATEPKLPDEEDYAFKGWYTDRECTTPFDFAQTPINNDITLYAKWVNRYTVFYKDGGHGQSTMPADEKVEEGKLASRPADPTEDGWKFKSWHLKNDYKDNPFDFDTPITENITLYAKWTKTWTVTFDVNGHGTAPDPQTVDIDTKAVRPADPAQTGWRFDGWYTDKDCTAAYDFDSVVTDNITLYAKWVQTVTVTYHVGSYGTAPASQTVDAGKKFTRPADPVDSRAIFQGWYTDENYTTAYDFGSAVETDLNLYAKWKDGYRVVFQTAYGTAPAEQKVALNGKATKPADPTATGYIFKGWYTSQLYTAEFDFNTPITADTTLYAKWNETYTVTFNVGDHGTAPTAQTVENGGKATKPENPTAKGWRFDGWYTDERYTARYDFDKAVTANTTLYAKWTQLFTLTFETNGGTKIDSVEAPDGSLVYLGSYKPTKSGYYFVGWYTDKNLTRASRVGYVRMDGNKTVYAKFAVADKTNPKTADPALPGLALAVLSFSTVGLAAMGLKKRK